MVIGQPIKIVKKDSKLKERAKESETVGFLKWKKMKHFSPFVLSSFLFNLKIKEFTANTNCYLILAFG